MVQDIHVAAGSELPWVPPGCREMRVSAPLLVLCDSRQAGETCTAQVNLLSFSPADSKLGCINGLIGLL